MNYNKKHVNNANNANIASNEFNNKKQVIIKKQVQTINAYTC